MLLSSVQSRIEFFKRLEAYFPEARIELDYVDSFTLLIAVVLSARTTDKAVNKVLPRLFADGSTPEVIYSLGYDEIESRINTLGLYRNKAKAVFGIAEIVMQLGQVPDTLEGLLQLPGVGRKTANVMLVTAFKQCAYPVDTHVFRVSNCTGLAPGKTPSEVEMKLHECVPEEYKYKAHALLVLFGRYICKARPKCEGGCMKNLYSFKDKNSK